MHALNRNRGRITTILVAREHQRVARQPTEPAQAAPHVRDARVGEVCAAVGGDEEDVATEKPVRVDEL